MKQRSFLIVLVVALLLSVGFNLGLLVAAGMSDSDEGDLTAEANREVGRDRPERSPEDARRSGARGERDRFQAMVERLDLDAEQRRRFHQIHRRMFEDVGLGRRQLGQLREQLVVELRAEQPSPDRLRELVRRMSAMNAKLDGTMVRTTLETREILDPEQEEVYLQHFAGQILRAPPARDGGRGMRRSPADRSPPDRPPLP